jgi:hypothetical protein
LIQADNLLQLENNANGGDANDPFYLSRNSTLSDTTTPNSKLWSGQSPGWSVTSISSSAATMTATLTGPPTAPAVATGVATAVQAASATLNGTVNDNNAASTVLFQYGVTSGYGLNVSGGSVVAGSGNTAVHASVSGLACNTAYHFRVKATNTVGTSYGNDMVFATTPCVPGAPSIISVSAGNSQASVSYLPPASDGGSPITKYTITSSGGQAVSGTEIPITVPELINGTIYTVTVTATNVAGTSPASSSSANLIPGVIVIDTIDATGYQLLQNAYDSDLSSQNIKILAGAVIGNLAVTPTNSNGSITIIGGYNDAFSSGGGLPSVLGKVTLSAGTTRFQNVIVTSP